jgi:hypothetical protein
MGGKRFQGKVSELPEKLPNYVWETSRNRD